MPTIFCSACADTSSLARETCWQCGARVQESYTLTSRSLLTLAVVVTLSIGTVWAFAQHKSPVETAMYPAGAASIVATTHIANGPDKLARSSADENRLWFPRALLKGTGV